MYAAKLWIVNNAARSVYMVSVVSICVTSIYLTDCVPLGCGGAVMSMSQQVIFMSIFPPVVVVVKAVSKQHPSQRRRGR